MRTLVSDIKFPFSNYYPMGWKNLLGNMFSSFFAKYKVAKG